MTFDRDKYLKLKAFKDSGELDSASPEVRSRVNEYIRGYEINNPQERGLHEQTPEEQQTAHEQRKVAAAEYETKRTVGHTPMQDIASNAAIQTGATKPVTSGLSDTAGLEAAAPELRQQYEQGQADEQVQSEENQLRQFARNAFLRNNRLTEGGSAPESAIRGMSPIKQAEWAQIDTMPVEQLRQMFGRALAANDMSAKALATASDPSLPSASGLKTLFRPPELPQDLQQGTGPKKTIYFREPSEDDFHAALREQLGPEADALKIDSPAYKAYADALYKGAYDQAQARGDKIVRLEYSREKGVGAQASAFLQAALEKGLNTATLGGLRVAEAALGGKQGLEQAQAVEAGSPGGGMAGELAGGILGAPGKLWGLTERIPGVRSAGASAAGRLLASGARGALTAAGSGAIEDAANAVAEALANKDVSELKPDLGNVASRAGMRAAMGGGLGVGGELLGMGAGHAQKNLRNPLTESGRIVRELDQAGVKLGLGGPKVPPAMQAIEARAAEQNISPAAAARQDIEEPMLQAFTRHQESSLYGANKIKTMAAKAEGDVTKVPWNVIDELLKKSKATHFENGRLMFGADESSGAAIDKFINGPPRVMDSMDATLFVSQHPEARIYRVSDLKRAGLKIPISDPDKVVVIRGVPMNAQEALDQLDTLNRAAGDPNALQPAKDAADVARNAMRSFIGGRDAKGDIDAFPKLGRAIDIAHKNLTELDTTAGEAGLPKRVIAEQSGTRFFPATGVLEHGERASFRSMLEKPTPEALPIQRGLAASAEVLPGWKAFRAELGLEKIRPKATFNPSGTVSSGGGLVGRLQGGWQGVRYRTDSIMGALAKLPEAQRSSLVAEVKRLGGGMEKALSPAEKELLIQSMEERTNKALEETTKVPLKFGKSLKENLPPIPEAPDVKKGGTQALDKTVKDKTVRDDQVRAEPPSAPTDLTEQTHAVVGKAMQYLRDEIQAHNTPVKPSGAYHGLRAGRIGGGGIPAGQAQKNQKLSPLDLAIIRIILSVPEPEKPQKVAAQ